MKEILVSMLLVGLASSSTSVRSSLPGLAIEICDNALDDDGDGLIDLNDPDCDCPPPEPPSLIPNPSFEEHRCCPGNNSQMYCSADWVQASVPTTDYLNTCGWMGWDEYPPPLPLPDGVGCIGFRDGDAGTAGNGPQPNWKEYAGVCLTESLKIGEIYRIEFYVGFAHPRHSPPVNVAFYGASSCSKLPFNEDDADFGCPTNEVLLGWVELNKVRVAGANNWQKAVIEFSPSREIEALAIGPDCSLRPSEIPLYYFLDDLILANREDFDFEIRGSGNACAGTEVLEILPRDTLAYQWYKDGVALIGETGPQLQGPLEGGLYRVRLTGPNSCALTESYDFRIPVKRGVEEIQICAGDQYAFNGQMLTASGAYLDTLQTAAGCDSILELRLSVTDAVVDTVYAKIFDAESWTVGDRRFDEPGEYTLTLQSSGNCDSLVHLVLDRYDVYIPTAFSPNGDGVNDFFTIYGDSEIEEVQELRIFNRWGAQVFLGRGIAPGSAIGGWDGRSGGKPAPAGVYIYQARIVLDDGEARKIPGTVTLMR